MRVATRSAASRFDKRLVEQEDLRIAHDGPADGDALALAARQRLGQAVKVGFELQDVGGIAHAAVDLVLAEARDAHAEGHVLVDRHVRVERVALEHHGDAALGRRDVVDQPPVDVQLAAGDFLESGDHAQQCRLAAAGRSDENDELALGDVEIDAVDHLYRAIGLADLRQLQLRPCSLP